MRLLHISEYCHAGSVGGTERYLLDLIRGLDSLGMENRIGWLGAGRPATFEAEGITIHPLPGSTMRVDEPPPELLPAVESVLQEFQPGLLHFHTFGLAEAAIARFAAQRGIPYLFTYHSPGWTCRREDLLIWGGRQPCDGEVRTWRCAACKVQQRLGGPPLAGYLGAVLSAPLDWMFARSQQVNFRRRICFLSDTRRYRRALREFLGGCALAVSCSEWGHPILTANGARPDRVKVIAQGVPHDFIVAAKAAGNRREANAKFTIGYIGRVTAVKGVDILAEAFALVPGADLRLKIYGFEPDGKSVAPLNEKLLACARQDSRIQLCTKLSLPEMVGAYSGVDMIAIPSVWPETGPLVLFEALQMGVPVFGSNRLGHPGLLPPAGMLVEPNTAEGWRQALTVAAAEFRAGQWNQRREQIRRQPHLRSMAEVAAEMAAECRLLS